MQRVNSMKDITLFAPTNEAWNDPVVQNIIRDKARMRDILNLHVVKNRMNIESIRQGNIHTVNTNFLLNLNFRISESVRKRTGQGRQ